MQIEYSSPELSRQLELPPDSGSHLIDKTSKLHKGFGEAIGLKRPIGVALFSIMMFLF